MAFNNKDDQPKFKNQFSRYRQRQGLGNATSFQSPGYPWLTGSEVDPNSFVKVQFPNVTRGFTIRNTDRFYITNGANTGSAPLAIYFGPEPSGSPVQITNNHSYVMRGAGDEKRFEIRTDHIYVNNVSQISGSGTPSTGSFQIFAELTPTSKEDMIALTGSGIDE